MQRAAIVQPSREVAEHERNVIHFEAVEIQAMHSYGIPTDTNNFIIFPSITQSVTYPICAYINMVRIMREKSQYRRLKSHLIL